MLEPVHRSIVVLDIESSGRLDGPQKVAARSDLYRIISAAQEAASIPSTTVTEEDRGDGVFLLIGADVSIRHIIDPFLTAIDAALHDRRVGDLRLRLRAVVHQGAVNADPKGSSGSAIDLAFAMVDAPQLREALQQSPTGRMALVVSNDIYRDAIRGHDMPDPTSFRMRLLRTKYGEMRTYVTVTGTAEQPVAAPEPEPERPREGPPPGTMYNVSQRDNYGVNGSVGRDFVVGVPRPGEQ
ncbi:hypothetical protein [Actinoplanes sp. NPDC051859]|uniref:hypothetical protein n=1 Tax=Actinoplanes sp. NPDC051859 TaxID=3363909 RepID=UPI0037ACBC73